MSAVSAAGLWLPWYRTGATRRSAFRLASALRAAGLLTRPSALVFVSAVAVVPGLAAAAWLLWAVGFRRTAAFAVAGVGALTGGCALGVCHAASAGVTRNVTIEAVIGPATVLAAVVYLHGANADRPRTP